MPPHIARFLELATRTLAGSPALRDEAKGELMGRLGHRGVPVEEIDLAGAVRRLEQVGRRKAWPAVIWKLALLLVTVGLLTVFSRQLGREATLVAQRGMVTHADFHRWRVPGKVPLIFRVAERQAPDLLMGTGDPEEIANLRRRFPNDLAILQQQIVRGIGGEQQGWRACRPLSGT